MEKKKQPDKPGEKPADQLHHKNVEHDQELPQQLPGKEEELDIIPGDDDADDPAPSNEAPPPGEGP